MIDVEILISAIQERPELWDKKNKRYYNRFISHREWKAVAKIIGSTSSIVKKKWKNLRDTYFKEYKKVPTSQSGSDSDDQPEYNGTWPFFESMSFLKVVVNPRKSKGNINDLFPTVFANVESDSKDLSESIKISTSIPEDPLNVNMKDSTVIEDTQNSEKSLPSTSHPTAATVRQYSNIKRKTSSKNRKRKGDVMEPFLAIEQQKIQLHGDQLDEDDENFHWFKFILPFMKQLPPLSILRFRTHMQQLLLPEILKINTTQTSNSQNDYYE